MQEERGEFMRIARGHLGKRRKKERKKENFMDEVQDAPKCIFVYTAI